MAYANAQEVLDGLSSDTGWRSGRTFEDLCAWLLRHDPRYRAQIDHDQVWRWAEWPDRWGADAGIDLVARTNSGELWAVQCKAYDPARTVTKRDVDTFLSESARVQFAFRLLISTTDLVGRNARRTIEGQEKPLGLLLRSDLLASAADWTDYIAGRRPRAPEHRKPRPHQRRAIREVIRGFRAADRGRLLMACGTGKTLTALWIAEALESARTIVLVPSLSLLKQTLNEWTATDSRGFAYLAICSDESVADDRPVSLTADLGVPVTTDPARIESFLRRRGPSVVFCTYQSSRRVAEALERGVPRFDLAIADEAHRCAGLAGGEFSLILDAKAIRARRRLFMTATPRVYTGRLRREAESRELEVASMDDERLWGPIFHRLTWKEAIDRDLLADYQVLIVGVDDETIRNDLDQGALLSHDGEAVTDARTLAAQVAVLRAMRDHDLRRVLSFHTSIPRAKRFSQALPATTELLRARRRPRGPVYGDYVSGEMPAGQRAARLERFVEHGHGGHALIANVRCLAEGVDVPTLDGVVFVDPRRSQIDIVQAVGRAIRKSPTKEKGTILVPVFIPTDDDPGTALNRSVFAPVCQILRAMRAHDELLGEELDGLRRGLGRQGRLGNLPGKIVVELPKRIGPEFADALYLRLVERATSAWEYAFGLLERYVEREGDARVRQDHVEDGFKLGLWVVNQRGEYRNRLLSEERARRLEGLHRWAWDAKEAAWDDGYQALLAFVAKRDTARVPAGHCEGGFDLARWVKVQRILRRRGHLTEERIAKLDALPRFSWDAVADAWEDAFALLEKFTKRKGHSRVPQSHREDGFGLGPWLAVQRKRYREHRLPEAYARRLTKLAGWTWDPHGDAWQEGFESLNAYVGRKGNAMVPKDHCEDGYPLGNWVDRQRQQHRKDKLTKDRQELLEEVNGWSWEPDQEAWDRAYGLLQRFVAREHHADVPQQHAEDGFRLGIWVTEQRSVYRERRLRAERIEQLEAITGWAWNSRDAAWRHHYELLLEYVARKGDALVPAKHREAGSTLGSWVDQQRQRHRNGNLPEERRRLLDEVPGWSWSVRPARG